MLLSVPEAQKGHDYLTARDRLRVTFRGEAPKRAATNPTEYLLYSHETRRELRVPGSYMLETLDADSPLVGTAPRLDAFALKDVRWCREHVGQLSDADLAELATIDSRPGVRTAVASEVLRRAKERPVVAEPVVVPEPIVELDRQPLDPTEHILWEGPGPALAPVGPCIVLPALDGPDGDAPYHPAVNAAADDLAAPSHPTDGLEDVFGDLPTGEPLDPPDHGIAAAFPDDAAEVAAIRAEIDRTFDAGFADRLRAGEAKDLDATFPETHPDHPVAVEPADEELTQAIFAAGAVFGDRLLNLSRHPTAGWSLQLIFGNVPRTPFLGETPAEVIAAGQSWLERYTAPVTVAPPQPRRRQVRSAEPSADVAQKLATLEADNARMAGELAAATREGAMVVERLKEAEEERDDAKVSRDRYHAELLVENSRCADAMATANRLGPKVAHLEAVVADKDRRIEELAAERDETCAELRRVGAERDRLREEAARHEAEVNRLGEVISDLDEQLRAARARPHDDMTDALRYSIGFDPSLAPSKADRAFEFNNRPFARFLPLAPKAPPLSPEGKARADAMRRAYLTLADAAAWTVAAEEAQAVLRGGG